MPTVSKTARKRIDDLLNPCRVTADCQGRTPLAKSTVVAEMAIPRVPEQELVMESADSVKAFDGAGVPGGPLFPIYHFNATALSQLLPAGAKVLDLFCGSAQFLQYLLRGRDDLCGIGLDLSQGMLELAQKNVASAGLADRIQFVHADAVTADRAIKEPVAAVTCL